MAKGQFPFLTMKDLMIRLKVEWDKKREAGEIGEENKAPTRPTLYRMEKRGVWKPLRISSGGWRAFDSATLEEAIQNILKDPEIN